MLAHDLPPLRILFVEGASLSARHTLYALGPGHVIDVMDPSPLNQCRFSRFVHRWYRCPHYARQPEEFLAALVERLRAGRYDVLLPTHEQVYLLSRYRAALENEVGIALPDFAAMDRLQNKAAFMRLLDEMQLPHPATRHFRSPDEVKDHDEFPCYLKQGYSTAGCGVFYVATADDMDRVVGQLRREGRLRGEDEWMLQQPGTGVLSTVKAVFQRGRVVGAHMYQARSIGRGGMLSARVSATHPVVFEHLEQLGAAIGCHGALFVDYFFDPQRNRPEYIEANPRIGETVNPTVCGMNLAERLVRVSLGEPLPAFVPTQPRRDGVRTQSFFMLLITKAVSGAGRWDLLKEIFAKLTGRGLYRDSQDELTRPGEDWLSLLPALWICLQLLIWPARAKRIVQRTIDGYALPEAATRKVKQLPDDLVRRILAEAESSQTDLGGA